MIKLGILIQIDEEIESRIRAYAKAGFEAVSLTIWEKSAVQDLSSVLSRACDVAVDCGLVVSSLSVYGNPLRDDETGTSVRFLWHSLVREAQRLDIDLVSGFAGRVPGTSVEDSLPAWQEFFAPLAEIAGAAGTRLAFENCRLGDTWKTGKWNIAINPDAWDLMFALLGAPNMGLEWEPCHQIESLIDPHPQLETWAHRVFHVHGKDCRTSRDLLETRGIYGKKRWHSSVLPGQGDSDWRRLIVSLEAAGYHGSIDIENPDGHATSLEGRMDSEFKSLSYMKLMRS